MLHGGWTISNCRIQVCGPLRVNLGGTEVGSDVPIGQARTLLTYLVINRRRYLDRAQLADALWEDGGPPSTDRTIAALMSRLRHVIGSSVIPPRGPIVVQLPEPAWVDIEVAREAAHRADAAVATGDWTTAWAGARIALNIATRGLLPGVDLSWVATERMSLHDLRIRAWEAIGEVAIGLGGAELVSGRRASRELIHDEPLRESGYRLGMRVELTQGNPAEALRIYEELRLRLAEDLGVDPGRESRTLYEQVLASTSA